MSNTDKILEKSIDFADIKPFIPRGFTDNMSEDIFFLMQDVQQAIDSQLPIGIVYEETARIVLPHSLYLQSSLSRKKGTLEVPKDIHTRMRLYKTAPRTAIGMDAYQIKSQGITLHEKVDTAPPISKNGWKSFHLDKVSGFTLLTNDRIREIFALENDTLGKDVHLTEGFATIQDFVRHWNYPFREFYAQTPAKWDLRKK